MRIGCASFGSLISCTGLPLYSYYTLIKGEPLDLFRQLSEYLMIAPVIGTIVCAVVMIVAMCFGWIIAASFKRATPFMQLCLGVCCPLVVMNIFVLLLPWGEMR